MPDGTPEVRQGRKFEQVVDGATQVFLTEGYERASVDKIARRAGVSKATLYAYFPDKRLLFVEVMKRECARRAKEADANIDTCGPPEIVLTQVGTAILDIFLSDFGQQFFRTSIAESINFKELGQKYFDAGPALIERELVPYFEEAEERGELRIENKVFAAHQFAELCKAWIFPRRTLHVADDFPEEDKAMVVREAVAMFLARYGVDQ